MIGFALLWAAAAAAIAATLLPRGLGPKRWLLVAAGLAASAVVTLAWALLAVDLSLQYVAETTSRATPWPYRIAGLWGGMDGSMLFYASMTSVVAVVGTRQRDLELSMRVAAGISGALLVFTSVFANPFTELAVPAVDGAGLLAILQHPAMIYHPPLLYLGLTTLVIPFALTVQRVLTRQGDRDWRPVRRWLLASWTLLTVGMVAGSSWAYIELGWGGFWAWDPVENTALMPWMAITAWLHTSRITRNDGRLARSSAVLAMIPFALSLLGVYLTRSGITGSIHAFAEDPVIGRILLAVAMVVGLAVVAIGIRAPAGPPWGRVGAGRDSWLAGNGMIVGAALVFVLIGSAYPAYAQAFFGEEVAIDPTFFVVSVYPLALIAFVGLALALRGDWRRAVPARDWAMLAVPALAAFVAVTLLSGLGSWPAALGVGLGVAAVGILLAQLVTRTSRELVPLLAHLGIAVVIAAAAGSALGADFSGTMRPGESVQVGGHEVGLESISTGEAERFSYARAVFIVDQSKRLAPEIRGYEEQATPVAEPVLWSTPARDLTIAISLLFPDANAVEVSVFVRPLVWWVWVGSLLTAAAGLFALGGRGGAGATQRRSARAEPRAGETASGTSAR